MQHIPILQVVIPLIFAPVCILIRDHRVVWPVFFIVNWVTFAMACLLLGAVIQQGIISYEIGGWAAPWGIEYRIDILNAFVLLIIAGISALVASFSHASILNEIPKDRIYLFYTAYLLNMTGLFGVILTGDAFNMFVFIEIASLSSYALISIGKDNRSLLAAFRYLIMGTVGATFILIGVGLLYVITGTLNIHDLSQRIPDIVHTHTFITALVFLLVGIFIKFAMFPFHWWLPGAYTYAPSVVSAYLAGTSTKVFIYVLVRFIFSVFDYQLVMIEFSLSSVMLIFSILAIFTGSLGAIYQVNIKKILAYSSIAQIGYMVLGISLVSHTGIMAGILHMFNHALIKSTLFMSVACVAYYQLKPLGIADIRGISRQMPWTFMAFALAGLSLIGIPPTVGFISKWYLIKAALETGSWLLVLAVLTGSLLAIIYIWKIIEAAFFQRPASGVVEKVREAPLSMLIPLWLLVFANFYFGIRADITTALTSQIAGYVLGGG